MNEWTTKLSLFLLREFRIRYLSTRFLAYWNWKSLHSDFVPVLFPTLLLFFLGSGPRTFLWDVTSLNQEERALMSGNKRIARRIQTGPAKFPPVYYTSYSLTHHVPPWLPTPHKIFRSNCLLSHHFLIKSALLCKIYIKYNCIFSPVKLLLPVSFSDSARDPRRVQTTFSSCSLTRKKEFNNIPFTSLLCT